MPNSTQLELMCTGCILITLLLVHTINSLDLNCHQTCIRQISEEKTTSIFTSIYSLFGTKSTDQESVCKKLSEIDICLSDCSKGHPAESLAYLWPQHLSALTQSYSNRICVEGNEAYKDWVDNFQCISQAITGTDCLAPLSALNTAKLEHESAVNRYKKLGRTLNTLSRARVICESFDRAATCHLAQTLLINRTCNATAVRLMEMPIEDFAKQAFRNCPSVVGYYEVPVCQDLLKKYIDFAPPRFSTDSESTDVILFISIVSVAAMLWTWYYYEQTKVHLSGI